MGGANAHIILDDAFHYLQEHGLSGFHHCDISTGAAANGTTTNGIDINGHSLNGNGTSANGHSVNGNGASANGHSVNGNGTSTNGHSVNGNGASANGASANGVSDERSTPKLLIWSAADAAATDRMLQAYQSYYQTHIIANSRKLDQLAYTLATRRSIMPWRSFAVVESVDGNDTDDPTKLTLTVPIRASSEKASIGFIFTGQGAQYAGMGLELLQYPVFESSLRGSDRIFASLGADWSLLGELKGRC